MSDLWEHIDLCSGIGGFSLGFQWAELSEPILFCELDEFCQKILNKHWPDVTICNDVKELANDTNAFIPRTRGRKRILTAGYPCQPFSQAGQRRGTEDPRHIWPYILRIIQQERFDVCVFENVSGHISLGLDEVLHDLEGEGYNTRTFVLPAEACGASHRRDRLWIIARNMADTNDQGIRTRQRGSVPKPLQQNDAGNNHAERVGDYDGNKDGEPQVLQKDAEDVADTKSLHSNVSRKYSKQSKRQIQKFREGNSQINVADTNNERSQRWLHGRSDQKRQSIKRHSGCSSTIHGQPEERKQATQRRLGRMADGLSAWMDEPVDIPRVASGQKNRTHRLKALGNAIVPQIAQRIGIAIKESFL